MATTAATQEKINTVLGILARNPGKWLSHRQIWLISRKWAKVYGTPIVPVPHHCTTALQNRGLCEKTNADTNCALKGDRIARITERGLRTAAA